LFWVELSFKDASGALTLQATSKPVLFNAANEPVFFAVTGGATGMIAQ
jgi:hypothetical protein